MTGAPPPRVDEVSFDELYARYAPVVYRRALQGVRYATDRAHDIVQLVFIAVWKQYDRDFRGQSEQRHIQLIMTMTARRIIDEWRKAEGWDLYTGVYAEKLTLLSGSAWDCADPAEHLLADEDLDHLHKQMEAVLTPTEYKVILLALEFGVPDDEIAAALRCSVSTVQSHKSRARKKIAAIVDLGSDHEGTNLTVDQCEVATVAHTGHSATIGGESLP